MFLQYLTSAHSAGGYTVCPLLSPGTVCCMLGAAAHRGLLPASGIQLGPSLANCVSPTLQPMQLNIHPCHKQLSWNTQDLVEADMHTAAGIEPSTSGSCYIASVAKVLSESLLCRLWKTSMARGLSGACCKCLLKTLGLVTSPYSSASSTLPSSRSALCHAPVLLS